ncbi:MAG: FN3 associated domain-containing protein, partial [Planctomycetota bacterium]
MSIFVKNLLLSLVLIAFLAGSTVAKSQLVGDLNADLVVDFKDVLTFSWQWLAPGCLAPGCKADLDGVNGVNIADFALLANNWQVIDPHVVINEFMASNTSQEPLEEGELLDGNNESSDWIEIYNPTDTAVNLDGWYLTNSKSNLTKWQFPDGLLVEPGGFLIIFASRKPLEENPGNYPYLDSLGYYHTNFNLEQSGDYLALVAADGITISHEYAARYPTQLTNVSYGLAQHATKLVSTDANASYHVPTSGDASLGTDWADLNFDDSTWTIQPTTNLHFGEICGIKGLNYEYFEGYWSYVPNFDDYTPRREGIVSTFDITPRLRDDYFGFRFTGFIEVPLDGVYTFYTTSDDGSLLFIDGYLVVNNDGNHSVQERSGSIYLDAGMHSITVEYFEGNVNNVLIVSYEGPGIPKKTIPNDVLCSGTVTNEIQNQMQYSNASLWTRIEFEVEDPEVFDMLALRIRYEDGFMAYLNGVEVAQCNAPSPVQWDSMADSDRPIEDSSVFEEINLMAYLDLLLPKPQKNVLAIQGLNDDKNNGEFRILPELVAAMNRVVPQYFTRPTPGTFNISGALGVVSDVWVSTERTFYTGPPGWYIDLTLSNGTDGAEIRYTDDGSRPTITHGTPYNPQTDPPLEIDETTVIRAVAVKPGWLDSKVETHTYIFPEDVERQSPLGEPPGPNWPTTSVNGQVIDYGMDPCVVNDSRYTGQMKNALKDIPTISLVTDLANLFDPTIGIYVNAQEDGRTWERPTSVELINPDGSEGFQIDAGLRIRGGYSRQDWNPKHAFRLFFRALYGKAKLKYPLFEDEGADEFDNVDLRTSQNYCWAHGGMGNGGHNTMVREVFSRDIQGAMGHPYTRSRYYHLYINGHYWGLFQTQERAEASHAESYLGGDKDDYDVVKTPGMNATDGNRDALDRLYDETMLGLDNYERYCRVQGFFTDGTPNPYYERLLDVDNVIDFMIIEYYTGDRDGPASRYTGRPNNTYGTYNRVNPDGWKWFHHDNEHTLGAGSAELNMVTPFSTHGAERQHFNPHWLHEQLANINTEYRLHFADHVYKHFFNDGFLSLDSARNYIQNRADQINMAIIAESARWGDSSADPARTKDDDWLPEINRLLYDTGDRRHLTMRVDEVMGQFRGVGWYPFIDPPTFNQHGGEVPSGFELTMNNPNGSGNIYYTLDGTDPRQPISGNAVGINYNNPVTLNKTTLVKARVLDGITWSALNEAIFAIGPVVENLRITEIMYHPLFTGNINDPNK